jgi:sugar phosphate isomerase/epimerase
MADFTCGVFVNITNFDPTDWEKQLQGIDRLHGIEHLELWLEFEPSTRELEVMASVFGGRSLIMHGPFIGTSFASEWRELVAVSLDRARRAIEAAAFLDCKVVTLHAGSYGAFGDHQRRLEQVVTIVDELAHIVAPRVTIENLPSRGGASREAIGSIENLEALCSAVPNLAVTLDVGHCLENDEEFVPFVRRHVERIANIHLHDGPRGQRSHKPLGTGDLDLDGLLNLLIEVQYSEFLTLETIGYEATALSCELLSASLDRVEGQRASLVSGA